jgi:hypothetical protein
MSFANSASDAAAGAADYVARCLALLGDRDPFAVQEATPGLLRQAVAGLGRAALTRPEAPGKWSILQVVRHLADTEIVYGYRLRLILAEDEPAIPGYDQDLWAGRLGYPEEDPEASLDELETARRGTLRLLRRLDEAQWRRAGLHAERGRETVRDVFRLLAAHDLIHLRQIERIRAAHGDV